LAPLAQTQPDGSYTILLNRDQGMDLARPLLVTAAILFMAGFFVGRLTKA
jgi:hypothetical protein